MELRELLEIEGSGSHVGGDDSDEYQRASEEGIERQFHRAVLFVCRSPDRDEEILGGDHEFVKDKKEEEIGAEKDTIRAADHQEQPEEEFVRPMIDVP